MSWLIGYKKRQKLVYCSDSESEDQHQPSKSTNSTPSKSRSDVVEKSVPAESKVGSNLIPAESKVDANSKVGQSNLSAIEKLRSEEKEEIFVRLNTSIHRTKRKFRSNIF